MALSLTFLGTGTSQGIPIIACRCPVCLSNDLRDKRMRTSALVTLDQRNILIDTTPELRLQCLANNITRLDTCLITHTHADHIMGMDDIRRFNQVQRMPIDVWVSSLHRAGLERVFGYAQAHNAAGNPDLPQLVFRSFEPGGDISLYGHNIRTFPLPHGNSTVIGYRIGPLAYCTDVSTIPDDIIADLQDLRVLVLGALRERPHPKHLSLEQAIATARKINARSTYFVHMAHQISHQHTSSLLPTNMYLAYDGLQIDIPD